MDNNYHAYFDAMPCFATVQDRELRIIDANRRFIKNFGDYAGRYCYQIYKHRPEKCEDCPVERTFRDGTQHRSEEKVQTLDGREVSVIVYTTPIRGSNGEIEAVMEMSTDITEIKDLQTQLRDSQDKYRLLFEEVPCFISMQDRDLRIIEANRQHREAFGTFYGCKCYEVYKQQQSACDPCIVRQTFEDGQIHLHEEVVTARGGNRINVMVTTAPVYDLNGKIESVIEMSTDITQIRQLQSKLASVGMIISSISHDLKGLLNGMDGGIYLVNTGLGKNDQKRLETGWEMILRNVDRIRSTVLDILYYAKDREPQWEALNVAEIVEEVCDVMVTKAADHKIDFSWKVPETNGDFEADPGAVRSMLINILDNAFDACRVDKKKDEHRVSLITDVDKDKIRFKIADNGIGMDEEARKKSFTLFFSSKGSGGTGLGLFIANKIAVAHGGGIELKSEPSVGTDFSVTLPRRRPETVPTSESVTLDDVADSNE